MIPFKVCKIFKKPRKTHEKLLILLTSEEGPVVLDRNTGEQDYFQFFLYILLYYLYNFFLFFYKEFYKKKENIFITSQPSAHSWEKMGSESLGHSVLVPGKCTCVPGTWIPQALLLPPKFVHKFR